jgi:hypothetical protein
MVNITRFLIRINNGPPGQKEKKDYMEFRMGRVSTGSGNDYYVEINSLEELIELVKKEGGEHGIIISENIFNDTDGVEMKLEIYDDYKEYPPTRATKGAL